MKEEIQKKLQELKLEQQELQKDRDTSIKAIDRLKHRHYAPTNEVSSLCPTTPSNHNLQTPQRHMPKTNDPRWMQVDNDGRVRLQLDQEPATTTRFKKRIAE